METISELLKYCYENNKSYVMVEELKALSEGCPMKPSENNTPVFPIPEDEECTTEKAINLLTEIMVSHKRTFSKLEHKLIQTGVLSGRCYVCWHTNKYYPGATVDNLRQMGFDKFYETYKSNWEKVKDFRKKLIEEK